MIKSINIDYNTIHDHNTFNVEMMECFKVQKFKDGKLNSSKIKSHERLGLKFQSLIKSMKQVYPEMVAIAVFAVFVHS